MKKLIIITIVLMSLIVVNILVNDDKTLTEKNSLSLSEAINIKLPPTSFEIITNDNKIQLIKSNNCYNVKSINYCADSKKVNLLKKFLSNKVKDIYDNNKENLDRLGFNNTKKNSLIILDEKITLIFGKLNQYNEIYILVANKIYKVDYYSSILETSTKLWIDKSSPILNLTENDDFHIKIYKKWDERKACANVSHIDLISNINFSNLRNTFFDLYAADVNLLKNIHAENFWSTLIDAVEDDNEMLYTVHIEDAHKKTRIGSKEFNVMLYNFKVWKYKHMAYLMLATELPLFIIPNSVYENIKSYCVE
mgnify:CR=1 FL=1